MISTACYPYPVNEKATRPAAMRPHIYSPSESHSSPRHIMYPHPHVSSSPSPSYIYSGYEQYYSKNSWMSAAPGSWPTYYPYPLSSSLPDNTIHPKVTILPPQPVLVSDIDTPSSLSSHSVLTPADEDETMFQPMEFDEFDCDDEDDYIDSDFADEMEGIDETDLEDSLYGATAPHAIKSTSALEGALGDTPSSCNTNLGLNSPADRRLSASVPGYPSASHRGTSHHRQSSSPAQHMYTHRAHPSTAAQTSSYTHISSSSLAGAFVTPSRLPILQPQPIRPIPPIPIAELTSSADDARVLPLLCQPVSDAVRYQFNESSDACFRENADMSSQPFTPQTFCQAHPTDGTGSVGPRFSVPAGVWICG